MTINEAISELEDHLDGNIPEDYPDTAAAIQLGIEALNRIGMGRRMELCSWGDSLPGETEK